MPIRVGVAGFVLALLAAVPASASGFQILYSFPAVSDGNLPGRSPLSLARGPDGLFYGVMRTVSGGDPGAIFQLRPPAAGQTQWQLSVLYQFTYTPSATQPGGYPEPNLLIDSHGNIYGGTTAGYTVGTNLPTSLYRLSPPAVAGHPWSMTVLFPQVLNASSINGLTPFYRDVGGSLFGLASFGQSSSVVTPFVLSPTPHLGFLPVNGPESSFPLCDDGPVPNLILGEDGSFYGTTDTTVYRLTRPAAGKTQWTLENIHVDTTVGICGPIIADRSLDIYAYDVGGNVYELIPSASAPVTWSKSVLYAFSPQTPFPSVRGPLINWKGVLYGIAFVLARDDTELFHLAAPPPGGPRTPWVEQTFHVFKGGATDGSIISNADSMAYPPALVPVTQTDGSLALYGVTVGGGAANYGVFFKAIP